MNKRPEVVVIIPARYASTRFEGKPLADICGKPMIRRVYERCCQASVDDVIVATDDDRILKCVHAFGGKAIKTSSSHPSGTDRLAEVAAHLSADFIVNVQGDEPLIHPDMIDSALKPMLQAGNIQMSALKKEITDMDQLENPSVVKVVVDKNDFAIYFSRCPIPFNRELTHDVKYFKHIGLYVYQREFLLKLAKMSLTPCESAEKLEQLRVIENGYRIKVISTAHDAIGVDTPEDLEKVKKMISENIRGI